MTKELYEQFVSGAINLFLIVRQGSELETISASNVFLRKEGGNKFSVLLWSTESAATRFMKSLNDPGWKVEQITSAHYSKLYYSLPEQDRPRLAVRIT